MKNNDRIKVSKYTFTIKDQNKFYLYNTLSNALLEVDEELFAFINHHKELSDNIGHRLDDKIVSSLMESKFITENDEDDFLVYKSNILSLRNEKHCAILTIAPTMDCCFNCHYCFEKTQHILPTPYYLLLIPYPLKQAPRAGTSPKELPTLSTMFPAKKHPGRIYRDVCNTMAQEIMYKNTTFFCTDDKTESAVQTARTPRGGRGGGKVYNFNFEKDEKR